MISWPCVEEANAGRRLYRIYGEVGYDTDETGTDLIAVAAGKIAVTPLHFDLTDHNGVQALALHDLDRLVPEPGSPTGPAPRP